MTDLKEKHVKVTTALCGPYVIVADLGEDDIDSPILIGPPNGYPTLEEARDYIEVYFANRKEPYLGIKFTIAPFRSPGSFTRFCSWED